MNLKQQLMNLCLYCNMASCSCLSFTNKKKFFNQIEEKQIKKKKWITFVKICLEKEEFSSIKSKLGTGGTFFKDHIELRGRVKNRVKEVLAKFNYVQISNG